MPLHKWMITRRARSYYHELEASQYLPPAKIRELQEKKLRRLITHAYHHVAYYRERLDALRPCSPPTSAVSTTCASCRC